MGIDIYRGNPRSREGATYAVCIVDKDRNIVYEAKDINIGRVIRIAFEYKPKYIVLDNLFELAPSKKNVYKVLSMFPYESRILLATYDPDRGFRDLKDVAFEHGIVDTYRKLDSLTAARVLALLGIYGVGYSVREWEERCRIIVAKGRSGRSGGSSEDRYLRNLRAVVLRVTRKIKNILDEHKISYQLTYRKSEGGFDRAEFIVDTSREKLYGLVKPRRGRLARIIIRPIIRSKITIPSNISTQPRYVIVGIDPGISYGIAVMDLSGKIVHVETVKNTDTGYIISAIFKHGTPILVATDKIPIPDAVRKISAVFGSRIYEPHRLYSDLEKTKVVESQGYQYSSIHERDAIFACILAYRNYQRKFHEVEKILKMMNLKMPLDKIDRIKVELIKGSSITDSIEKVIEEYMNSEEASIMQPEIYDRLIKNIVANESRLRNLEHRYTLLLQENEKLRQEIKSLRRELEKVVIDYESYKKTIKQEIVKEREIFALEERLRSCRDAYRTLESRIMELKEENERLKRLILEYEDKGFVKIPVLKDHRYIDEYMDPDKYPHFSGDALLIYMRRCIDEGSAKEMLSDIKRSIVILCSYCSFKAIGTSDRNIVCIDPSQVTDSIVDFGSSYVLLDEKAIEKIKELYRDLVKSLPSYSINSEDDLVRLIESYRSDRISKIN